MTPWLTVVGIGEDGWAGVGEAARQALGEATCIIGGERQLALLPDHLRSRAERWPSPFSLEPVLTRRGEPLCVLASGDPMFFGIGATLVRQLDAHEMRVFTAPSSVSLAAARLGWPLQETEVVSLVARPLSALNARIFPGTRLLILCNDGTSPAQVAQLLTSRGFGASRLTVLEHLGGAMERRLDAVAREWAFGSIADLNLLAVECVPEPDAVCLPLTPGLADRLYRHDGQLTKRDVRALTLARLAPLPGELLWDVGAGCGSIGIEWMRAHPGCRAIAVEADAGRQAHIEYNRAALGVPALQLVVGRAPAALEGLPAPDAIFIGGGVTVPGVMEHCWASLKPGGRLLANAVTLQSESMLMTWRERIGGELTRISVSHAQPLGGFDTWRGALPITLLQVEKPL
jgi:precorrin-6Y C5,15-methyltransferase (decarboxylating)